MVSKDVESVSGEGEIRDAVSLGVRASYEREGERERNSSRRPVTIRVPPRHIYGMVEFEINICQGTFLASLLLFDATNTPVRLVNCDS